MHPKVIASPRQPKSGQAIALLAMKDFVSVITSEAEHSM
jgi:hypothetical protein